RHGLGQLLRRFRRRGAVRRLQDERLRPRARRVRPGTLHRSEDGLRQPGVRKQGERGALAPPGATEDGRNPMKLHGVLFLALLLGADDAKDAKDQEKIQGTWKVVGVELEGKEILGCQVKEMTLIVSADKIRAEGDFADKEKYSAFT